MIKPWLFEFLPELGSPSTEPNAADVTALFGRYLDLWVRDEALGFEGIFFIEHHFGRFDCRAWPANKKTAARRHGRGAALLPSGPSGGGDRHAGPLDRRPA